MSEATTRGADGRSHPEQAASVDELVRCLRELRALSGLSYRELHRRLVRLRRSHGVAEEPAYATVYRCLQPGRSRLDIELVADIVTVLTDDAAEAVRWRHAYARIGRETAAPSYAAVLSTTAERSSSPRRPTNLTSKRWPMTGWLARTSPWALEKPLRATGSMHFSFIAKWDAEAAEVESQLQALERRPDVR